MNLFERYLSVWVLLCMVFGVALGKLFPTAVSALSRLEFGTGSQVNIPIAVLIWMMIYPMMLKIDFGSLRDVTRRPVGILVTLIVNWLVKPFSMAFFAWVFIGHAFSGWIDPETAKSYTAGLIILAAAPCTAMVFVWSTLTDGDPAYTLVQVAVNDLIMLVAFAPLVMLLCGVAQVIVPSKVLITSVVVFIVVPLVAGWLTRSILLRQAVTDRPIGSTRDRVMGSTLFGRGNLSNCSIIGGPPPFLLKRSNDPRFRRSRVVSRGSASVAASCLPRVEPAGISPPLRPPAGKPRTSRVPRTACRTVTRLPSSVVLGQARAGAITVASSSRSPGPANPSGSQVPAI